MMQLRDKKNTASLRAPFVVFVVLLLVALACLEGCGSSGTISRATHFVLVSDFFNNRVLIYNLPLSNGQSANVVLGQGSFTTSAPARSATGMSEPAGTAQDSLGNIYVSELGNCRVLQFKPPFANGMSASLVIGAPDFVTATCNTTQNGLNQPVALAFDGSGNLWVADTGNNRILQYKPPFSNGMNASVVLGQANFTSPVHTFPPTDSSVFKPVFIALDSSGNLWVADEGNNRVLEFKPPFANGMAASVVVGQADFVSNASATTATGLFTPIGVAFDSGGNLWVGDTFNNRVLQFKPPFANGMSASLVLGQASFTTRTFATTQNGFTGPSGIGFDSSGNLFVTDAENNRTLRFPPPFSNNQNADLVLGQANFTSGATPPTTATGQNAPEAVSAAF
jgi:sugar lactone lactonase YvrE